MTNYAPLVIVGASLAGAKAAETLRTEGFDGSIILIGAESERPYERPPLSKGYLRHEAERADVFVHDEQFYDDHGIELRLGVRVAALDPANCRVTLETGDFIAYHRLLIATGARPRRLTVPGADLAGVHYLRSLRDSDALGAAFATARHVTVIGAGWIGSEVAASARQLGLDVALIDPASTPLASSLGVEMGTVYLNLHASHGVDLHLGVSVDKLRGTNAVESVTLTDGTQIETDLVVVGIGALPNTELAAESGLTIGDGIHVSSSLETSAPGVFAAGDVAAAWHPWLHRRLRVEHWANAKNQGITAGRNMLDANEHYDRVPYFFSDQYELGMEYSGHAAASDQLVIRGDVDAKEFIAFWLADGHLTAAMNVNVWDVAEPIQALIRAQRKLHPNQLTDADVSLDSLLDVDT